MGPFVSILERNRSDKSFESEERLDKVLECHHLGMGQGINGLPKT